MNRHCAAYIALHCTPSGHRERGETPFFLYCIYFLRYQEGSAAPPDVRDLANQAFSVRADLPAHGSRFQ